MARRLTQGQFIVRANKGHPRTKDTHTPDQHTRTEDTHTKTACASSSAPTPVLVRRPNGCPSRARRNRFPPTPHGRFPFFRWRVAEYTFCVWVLCCRFRAQHKPHHVLTQTRPQVHCSAGAGRRAAVGGGAPSAPFGKCLRDDPAPRRRAAPLGGRVPGVIVPGVCVSCISPALDCSIVLGAVPSRVEMNGESRRP